MSFTGNIKTVQCSKKLNLDILKRTAIQGVAYISGSTVNADVDVKIEMFLQASKRV